MFAHNKRLQYSVHVGECNPGLANPMLEQFGGPDGELAAAMRYFTQALGEDDAGRKDMLLDIATEELSPHQCGALRDLTPQSGDATRQEEGHANRSSGQQASMPTSRLQLHGAARRKVLQRPLSQGGAEPADPRGRPRDLRVRTRRVCRQAIRRTANAECHSRVRTSGVRGIHDIAHVRVCR